MSWEIDLVISIYFKRILRDGIGREVGSGWETHVHMWWVHVNVWKNQYNTVKPPKIKRVSGCQEKRPEGT